MHVIGVEAKDVFQALADSTRLRILRLLIDHNEEACLCELVDSLQEQQYTLSKHLKVLKQAGLVSAKKEGRWVYHGLIKTSPLLKRLYSVISALPDKKSEFKVDAKRFQKRKPLREAGRCRTERTLETKTRDRNSQ